MDDPDNCEALKNLYEHFLLFSNTEALCRRLLEAWRPYYQRLQDYRRHCQTRRNDESDISIITQSRALEKTFNRHQDILVREVTPFKESETIIDKIDNEMSFENRDYDTIFSGSFTSL
jgi:hypothetical protein